MNIDSKIHRTTFDVSYLNQGVYFVRIRSKDYLETHQVVVGNSKL